MAAFLSAVSAVSLIFMMTAVGYLFGRAGWMEAKHKGLLVKLIMNVAMPAMCVNGLLGRVDRALLLESGLYVLLGAAIILFFLPISFGLGRLLRLPRERLGVFVVMCSFANAMFIGMPMCTALFGEEATPFVLAYYIANTTLFQTFGVAMLDYSGAKGRRSLKESLKKLLRPPLLAILVCVPMILLELKFPPLVMKFAGYMNNLVTPLALLYTGFVIYELGIQNIRIDRGILCSMGFRFILSPLLMFLLCRLFGVGELPASVLFIEISMPVMTQVVVLSADAGADEQYGAVGITASTLACFLAVPVLMMFV